MLRRPADYIPAGRKSIDSSGQRIRQDGSVVDSRGAFPGSSGYDHMLDQPHRSYQIMCRKAFRMTAHTPVCPVAAMENPVTGRYTLSAPSGGYALRKGNKSCMQFVKMSADAGETGKWDFLWRTTTRQSVQKSETEKCCALFPEGSTHRGRSAAVQGRRQTADMRVCRSRSAA